MAKTPKKSSQNLNDRFLPDGNLRGMRGYVSTGANSKRMHHAVDLGSAGRIIQYYNHQPSASRFAVKTPPYGVMDVQLKLYDNSPGSSDVREITPNLKYVRQEASDSTYALITQTGKLLVIQTVFIDDKSLAIGLNIKNTSHRDSTITTVSEFKHRQEFDADELARSQATIQGLNSVDTSPNLIVDSYPQDPSDIVRNVSAQALLVAGATLQMQTSFDL